MSPAPVLQYSAIGQFTGYPGIPVESPTTRWLDLLIRDATLQNGPLPDWDYDSNGLNVFGNSVRQSPVSNSVSLSVPLKPIGEPLTRQKHPFSAASTTSGYLTERIPHVGNQKCEELEWKALEPVELRPHETILFRHYVEHISLWVSSVMRSLERFKVCFLTISSVDGLIRPSSSVCDICSTSSGNEPPSPTLPASPSCRLFYR